MKNEILSPRIFLLFFLLFFLTGSRVLSISSAGVVLVSGCFFLIGSKAANFFEFKNGRVREHLNLFLVAYLVSALAIVLDMMQLGGIPLLNPNLYAKHEQLYLMIGFPIVPVSAILATMLLERGKKRSVLVILIATVALTTLLGYRTDIIATILSLSMVFYFFNVISEKKLMGLFLVSVLIIAGLGYVKASAVGAQTNPVEVVFYRIEGTSAIFNYIVEHSSLLGSTHGRLYHSALSTLTYKIIPGPGKGPRKLIAEFFGGRETVSFTATLLGPLYLDFGIFGAVMWMFLLGFMLNTTYRGIKNNKLNIAVYAILLSFALIGIETGILDIVIFYYLLALAYILLNLKVKK